MLHINHNKLDIYLSCSDIYIPLPSLGYLYMTYMSFKYVNRIKNLVNLNLNIDREPIL